MSITIGIDPHKASDTAVAVDDFETVIDEICIRTVSLAVAVRFVRSLRWNPSSPGNPVTIS